MPELSDQKGSRANSNKRFQEIGNTMFIHAMASSPYGQFAIVRLPYEPYVISST